MIQQIIKSSTSREHRSFYATVILIFSLIVTGLQFIATGTSGRDIDVQVFHPLAYRFRELVSPQKLDERIKIIVLDDTTVAHEDSPDLSLKDWSKLLGTILKIENVTVGIDKLFDLPKSDQNLSDFSPLEARGQGSLLGHIGFAHPGKIKKRQEVSKEDLAAITGKVFPEQPSFIPSYGDRYSIYASDPRLKSQFDFVGLANYKGDNHVKTLFIAEEGFIVHLGIAMGGNLRRDQTGFYSHGANIRPDKNGEILVNFASPKTYKKHAFSLLPFLERARRGMPIDKVKPEERPPIKPGDFVLILPAGYTGHTDFVQSPFGPIPGGYHLAALLNSALTKNWLWEFEDPGFFVVAAAAAGFGIGILLSGSLAIVSLLVAMVSLAAVSLALFSFLSIAISFPLPLIGILGGGLTGALIRSHVSHLESFRRSRELEVAGMVQKTFFPRAEKEVSYGCKIFGHFEPASECGGDWWGSFTIGDETYVILGDATGHGVPAALITSLSYAISKSIQIEIERSQKLLSPAQILREYNNILCSLKSDYAQMTLIVFQINSKTGRVLFANAANQPPFLLKAGQDDSRPAVLNAAGNLIGEINDLNFREHEIVLGSNDKIVVFTDGIFENRRSDEKGQLGKTWLKNVLHKHRHLIGRDFLNQIWSEYREATGSIAPDDDATVVVIERQ